MAAKNSKGTGQLGDPVKDHPESVTSGLTVGELVTADGQAAVVGGAAAATGTG
jgi:hypothetical protein